MSPNPLARRFRELSVADVHTGQAAEPTIVRRDTSIRELTELLIRRPATRVIAVIDANERLVGIIPARSLSFRVLAKVLPERALHLANAPGEINEFAGASSGETAGRVMQEPQAVALDAPVAEAFEKMMSLHLDGLPVVDQDQRVVGYLDIMEILLAWVNLVDGGF